MNNPYQQYKQVSINTAGPEELVLMLYDGGIKFVSKAILSIQDKKIEEANEYIKRSQDIVMQLMAGLDIKRGGQIAIDLELLYDYMHRRLIEANVRKDAEILAEMLNMFREFRETWAEAIKIAKHKNVQEEETEKSHKPPRSLNSFAV